MKQLILSHTVVAVCNDLFSTNNSNQYVVLADTSAFEKVETRGFFLIDDTKACLL